MTSSYKLPSDAVLEEVNIDYYSSKPYNVILNNISDDTVNILGDCGHFGRYGINIAKKFPYKRVYLCELRSEISRMVEADRFCKNENLHNIFFTVAGTDKTTGSVKLPFEDNFFDFVYTFELENFIDYVTLFKELKRVLKPGGKLLVGVPNYYNFFHTIRKRMLKAKESLITTEYEKSFKHSELKALFKENGFKDVKITGVGPMQSLMRLSKVSEHKKILNSIKWWSLIKIIDMTIIRLIDLLTKDKFSYMFGFEIIAVGRKDSGQWSE